MAHLKVTPLSCFSCFSFSIFCSLFEEMFFVLLFSFISLKYVSLLASKTEFNKRCFLRSRRSMEKHDFEGLHCVVALQAAAAGAAANFYLIALSCLATSAAQVFEYVSWVLSLQAAAASAEGNACKHFLGHTFDSCWIFSGIILLVLWKCSEVNSSMIATVKTQKCEELTDFRDFSILQASIQEVAVENTHSMCFDGHAGSKGKGSLCLGLEEASGRVDVPVSVGVLLSSEKVCRSSQSVALVAPGSCVVKTIFVKGVDGSTRVRWMYGSLTMGRWISGYHGWYWNREP